MAYSFDIALSLCTCGACLMVLNRDKPVIATDKDLRALRRQAKHEKFHFLDGLKHCPQCKKEIDITRNAAGEAPEEVRFAGPEDAGNLAAAFLLIKAQAAALKAWRDITRAANTVSAQVAAQTEMVGALIESARRAMHTGLDLRQEISAAAGAIDGMRQRVNEFADEALRAAEELNSQ